VILGDPVQLPAVGASLGDDEGEQKRDQDEQDGFEALLEDFTQVHGSTSEGSRHGARRPVSVGRDTSREAAREGFGRPPE
jgi:hypothetical protein